MSKLFLHLLNISITAGWIVLVVVLLRFVLKKAPKWMRVVLWGLVALRLLLPVSIESVTSLVPSAETVKIESVTAPVLTSVNEYNGVSYFYKNVRGEQIVLQSGFPTLNSAVNPTPEEAAEHFDTVAVLKTVAGWVWLIGVVGMLLYALISFLRLRHRVRASVLLEKGVYVCDEISDPFILGLIVPKIYLPSGMDEQTRAYVLAHEKAHLSRFDHIWKPLGFLLLSVYWFNPLLWLAYILLCRDIELACDEKVVKELDDTGKAAYSEALVTASISRRSIAACPLAFGETGVKSRVKSVLNYKKPAFWIILVALLAGIVTAVCFLTVPKKEEPVPAYAPIRYTEAALEVIENDGLLSEENFEDLSNFVRVLYNCRIVPFSTIECIEEVEKLSEDTSYNTYRIICSCDNQMFRIDAARSKGSERDIYILSVDEEDETRICYYYWAEWYGYDRHYIRENPEETRQISLTALEDHCGFNEEEAIGLMQEIDMLFKVRRILCHDIASIEKVKKGRNTVSLSLTSNFGESYNIVISTVNRPIILSITDSDGRVRYSPKEKKLASNTPLAYAPIQFKKAATDFIEKNNLNSEKNFQDLSNDVRVLHNCGIVPYSRIDCVEAIWALQDGTFLIKCSYDNQEFTITARQSENFQRYIYMYQLNEDDQYGFNYYTKRVYYKRDNPEETRRISLTALEEYCSLSEEEAIKLMQEIDLLFDAYRLPFYDITSIEYAERSNKTISLSLTSNFGKHYDVVISTVNRPIILSITDSNGLVYYTSE